MKTLIYTLFTALLISPLSLLAQKNLQNCATRITITCDYPFENASSNGTKLNNFSYNKNGKRKYVLQDYRLNKDPNKWEEFSISFTPTQNAPVSVLLNGVPVKTKSTTSKATSLIDNLKLNGELVENGDFEKDLETFSCTKDKQLPVRIEQSPNLVKFGKKCVSVWSKTIVSKKFNAQKGEPMRFSVMTKPRGEVITYDSMLDFAQHANMQPPYTNNPEVFFEGLKFDGQKSIDVKGEITFNINKKGQYGKYLYLLHTFDGLPNDDDKVCAVVVIRNSDGKVVKYDLKSSEEALDTNQIKLAHNAKPVFYADKKNKKGAIYLSRFATPSNAPIKSITFASRKIAQWKVFGATISDQDVRPYESWKPTPDQWKIADIQKNNIVIKNSALDLTHFFHDGEAGKYGRIIVSERGTFAFENAPDKDVRLKSFSLNSYQFREGKSPKRYERLKEYAELIKRSGYNCVRIDFDFIRDPSVAKKLDDNMDMLDYFMAELKKNGVYIHYVLAWRDLGLKKTSKQYERDEMKMRCIFLEPKAVEGWKKWTTYLLNHKNPYTNLALKDDPQIVQVEYFNEFSITLGRMNRMPKHIQAYTYDVFRKWLKEKYKTIENLNSAWNTQGFYAKSGGANYTSFDEVKDAVAHNHDWMIFAAESRHKFFEICTKTVRGTGYKGIIASENMGGYPLAIPLKNRDFDSIIGNTYYSHPKGFDYTNTSCSQDSSIGSAFPNIFNLTYNNFNDRPAGITEYNYCFWNQHRYEIPATYPLYASYQNFSMMTIHEDAVPNMDAIEMPYRKEINPFRTQNSPILRASEVFSTALFVRQDITPATPTVEIDMSKENLASLPSQIRRFNDIDARLSLLTGVRLKVYGERPANIKKVKVAPALHTIKPNSDDKSLSFGKWLERVYQGNMSGSTLPQNIEKLRELGILDKSNKTDITKGVFHSDTKEILLDAKNKMLKAITPKTELLTGKVLKNQKLDNLKVVSSSIPASVGVMSLDDKKIEESNRLIFAYMTQEANSEMEASFDQFYLVKMGNAPILLRTGKLKAELKLDPNKTYKLYPLSLNGERRAEIPCDFKNGILKIEIDTHALPNGPTTLFEIASTNDK